MKSHHVGREDAESQRSPSFGIRAATAGEAQALAALAAITFPLACPPTSTPADIAAFIETHLSERAFASYLSDPARALFVAESPEGLLGYTMLVFGEPGDADVAAAVATRPTVELSKCYVHPERHGGGVAADLIAASLVEATSRGASSVWLGVNQRNERANRFYEKHGFALVGTKRFLVGNRWEDDFVRERRLG